MITQPHSGQGFMSAMNQASDVSLAGPIVVFSAFWAAAIQVLAARVSGPPFHGLGMNDHIVYRMQPLSSL